MATKVYKNRQMETERPDTERLYFFPKNNPPVSIKARSQEEAEEQLAGINSDK